MSQETLEQVMADEREELALLRRRGYRRDVELLERLLERVARAAEDFLTWIPERDAELRSGRPVRWLRANFVQWAEDGNAKLVDGNRRYYRQVIIPRRGNPSAAREAGRQAGRKSA